MNSTNQENINDAFKKALSSIDEKESLEYDARMIMYRFLSEIEFLSDERGWTKKDLAEQIGTSASYITQLFRGSKLINLITVAKFQRVFDIIFEIKSRNIHEESLIQIDFEQINRQQTNVEGEGFWVFHKFKMNYNDQETGLEFKRKTINETIAA